MLTSVAFVFEFQVAHPLTTFVASRYPPLCPDAASRNDVYSYVIKYHYCFMSHFISCPHLTCSRLRTESIHETMVSGSSGLVFCEERKYSMD